MPHKAQDDELVMSLVEIALARPAGERRAYVESACENDADLFAAVWRYVRAEEQMGEFLRSPLIPAVEPPDPFEPGQLLDGRFRIAREVARGGMGIVYEARDERLERRIALKCAMPGFRKRLPPEVRNASEVSHPNVCKIFEIHTAATAQGDIDFLTMEFLDGQTLAERLRSGPLPEREALTVALQLCAGLAAAHRKQVVHGDLKSGNVILAAEPDGAARAVITDFGLAHGLEAAQAMGAAVAAGGTPSYMAPELWKGAKPSTATDIYALGVLLHELAYGKRAGGKEAKRPRWDTVIRRCVDADPARRFASAQEVAAALAPPARRWVLTAAAAALLAVFSGVAAYLAGTMPPESVRLAVLPFAYAGETSKQLAAVAGSARTSFSAIADGAARQAKADNADKARILLGATHVLQVRTEPAQGKLVLHAVITDTRAQVNTREWTGAYAPGETRFIPTALAGVVTGTFHLPALEGAAQVNAAALQDYLAGLEYLRRNSTVESAFAPLQRALAADSDSPLTHAALADAYWWKYQTEDDEAWLAKAQAAYRAAELRNPDVPEVLSMAGLLQAKAGRLEQAEASYLRAIEIRPTDGDSYRRLSIAYRAANDNGKALAAIRRAVEVSPADYRNHQSLGALHMRMAQYEEALKSFQKTVELAPREPAAHFVLGTVYSNLGRFAEAERSMRTSIDLGETRNAVTNLAFNLYYQGHDQEARFYFARAARQWPDGYLQWINLGTISRKLGLVTDWRAAYKKGLELTEAEIARNPRDAYVRACLAYCSVWLGDERRASAEVAQALQLAPNDTNVRRMAVKTYEALARRDEALALLRDSPAEVVADLNRLPDLADLQRDSRFQSLVANSHKQ